MFSRTPAVHVDTYAPAPATERGFGLHLTSHKKGNYLGYCHGRSVILRNIDDPTQIKVFSEHKAKVNVARFNPHGGRVASGDDEGNLIIWEIRSSGELYNWKSYEINDSIKDIAWSDDGKRLAIAGKSGGNTHSKCILVDSGNNVGEVGGHDNTVLAIDFRKHRPFRIVTASEDRTIRFHEGPPFKFQRSFTGHTNYVTCVRYSPDGATLISTGNDIKMNLFDAKTGEPTGEIVQKKKTGHKGMNIYMLNNYKHKTKKSLFVL